VNNRIIGINVSDPTQNESSTKATMGSLIFSSNASNAAAFGKEKKRKRICLRSPRETSEISNPKEEQKSLTERFFDCATRWPLIDPFAVTRENNFVSTNIQIIKGTKFVSRLRSLHARAVAFTTRNETFRLKDYSFCSRTKIARTKKKRARCSKTAPLGKNATHLNRSRSSASQTYLRAGDFKRELFFVFAFVFLCGKSGILCVDKRESTRLYLHLVAQNASFEKNQNCAEEF